MGKNTNTQITGTTSSYLSVKNVELALGSFISEQDTRLSLKVAVLGPTTRDDLLEKKLILLVKR